MIFPGGDIDELHERLRRVMDEARQISTRPGGPYVYGFTMRFKPDGSPVVEEFGNVSPYGVGGFVEPATDVIEKFDSVSVIVELPGVEKEDIDMRASVESVFIKVDKPFRRYIKDVRFSCRVLPESAVARYNNGVLELVLKRAEDGPVGRKVQIK